MNNRIRCRGEIDIALPIDAAISLFTPEGERAWAPGWDPQYPADDVDRRAVGTVFLTHVDDRSTIWVIVESGERVMRYARVTPGVHAGTVSVRCRPLGSATVAEVTYHLTALDDLAAHELSRFAAAYPGLMVEWERHIAIAVTTRG